MNIHQSTTPIKHPPDPVGDYLNWASERLAQLDAWGEILVFSKNFEAVVHELKISLPEVSIIRDRIKKAGDIVWERDHVFKKDPKQDKGPVHSIGTCRTVEIARARKKHHWFGPKAVVHRREIESQDRRPKVGNLETVWSNRIGDCETPEMLFRLEKDFETELEHNVMLQPFAKGIRQLFMIRMNLLRQKNPDLFPKFAARQSGSQHSHQSGRSPAKRLQMRPCPIKYKPGEQLEIIKRCLKRCSNESDLDRLMVRLNRSYEVTDEFQKHQPKIQDLWDAQKRELENGRGAIYDRSPQEP